MNNEQKPFRQALGETCRENLPFLLPVLIFIIVGGAVCLAWGKAETHLIFNDWHHPLTDPVFRILTKSGGGWLIVPTALITLFAGYRYTVLLMSSYGLSLGIVQLIKHVILPGMQRPARFFEEKAATIHTVEGVSMHSFHSFPSGHTTEVFSVMVFLALISRAKGWGVLFAIIAILGGYSRVYLSQHFMMDVVASAFLSTAIAVFFYTRFEKQKSLDGKSWMHRSLLG